MLHFFDVEGLLVRRWVPGQRRMAMEVWTGVEWIRYSDLDNLSRRGHRLTSEQAVVLFQATRARSGPPAPFSDEEANRVMSSRQRRA